MGSRFEKKKAMQTSGLTLILLTRAFPNAFVAGFSGYSPRVGQSTPPAPGMQAIEEATQRGHRQRCPLHRETTRRFL
jgi:hypothetical protein